MGVAALCLPVSASAEPVPARAAAEFRDSIGVQTHIVYYDTAYGDWARIVDKLDELGVDHLRDGAYANPESRDWNERYYQAVELAASRGKRFIFNMGDPRWAGGRIDQLIATVRGRLRHATAGLEGPNEYDLFHGGANWQDELREYQGELYRQARGEPSLADVPVIGPSLVYDDSDGRLGPLDAALDLGNIHPYTGGEAPSAEHLRKRFEAVQPIFGSKPLIATEVGFHNALAAQHGQPPISEQIAASYVLRTFLEHFRAGIPRTYVYELIDEKPDPLLREPEQHFGLLRNDFSEKPAFESLKAMLRLLGRPGPVTPRSLDVAVEGDTEGVQRMLLQKSDTRYTLVLWQAQSEWNTDLRQALPVAERSVSIALPADAAVAVSRPARLGDVAAPLGTRREAVVGVPADPILVELDFGQPPPTSDPPPPPADPPLAPPREPEVRCPRGKGGILLRKGGAMARISTRRSRTRPVRVAFCARERGKVVIELGRAGRGGRLKAVLARSALRVSAGRMLAAAPRWTRRAQTKLGAGHPAVRIRYRPTGARREVVLARRLDATAVRPRRQR